nr:RNA-directed DNA polymerase, eukaryota [Tanacetum cinerariifolium]
MSLMGRAKDVFAMPKLPFIISKEGFQNVKLSYLRGMWVLFEFDSLASKEKFLNHSGIGSWFTELIQATSSFENDKRSFGFPLRDFLSKLGLLTLFVRLHLYGDAWFPNFQEDDQDDLSSDGESQEGDVANKADNNESDVDRVSESSFMHENNTAYKDVNNCKKGEKKLHALKIAIKAWSKEASKWFNDTKITIQQNLSEVDNLIDQGKSNDEILIKRIMLLNNLQELNNRNATEISQKAKIRWSIKGDETQNISMVDFEKAFDSVKWDYLDETLKAFGFGSKWRNWISSCLNNAMGSVLINDSPTLEFQFHKGLKQGDPISHFLFILIMETFHLTFRRVLNVGLYNGISLNDSFTISHLFYADDIVFIGEWNNNNIQTLLSVLRCFYLASGFKINLHKSKLVMIGVSLNVVAAAASLIGCSILTARLNYLGVKNMVLTAKKNGGLGVSSFFAHNRALLFKWVWRFLTDGSSLWTYFIKSIFGNKGALDNHKLIPRRSPWQDVILAIHSLQREVALKVLYKRLYALEMCKSISVADKMGHPPLSHSFHRMPRGGVKQENYGLLCSKVADLVLPNISDRWCWSLEDSQEFLVKSSHILIYITILPKAEVQTRWLRVVPIKALIMSRSNSPSRGDFFYGSD